MASASLDATSPYVVEDCRGVLQVLSDGSIIRNPNPSFPMSVVDDGSVEWKDVLFSPAHELSLRIYRPREAQDEKLPIFFYFHGGGFCIGSRTWPNCQNYCLRLANELRALVVSPDYRLAPEHRLPAAVDDAFAAIDWLSSQAAAVHDVDAWLDDSADFSRVFISGDSAGGNLAHHLAVRFGSGSGRAELGDVQLRGFILLMPYFGGVVPTRSESECSDESFLNRDLSDRFWRLSIPVGANLDHQLVNPFGPESPDLKSVGFDPMLVVVGGKDLLRDRAAEYVARLKELGKPIELVDFKDQEHGFFTIQPWTEPANELMKIIERFMGQQMGISSQEKTGSS